MHITMCYLVRNEEAIIAENIIFHLSMGVDRFLVMDHLSDDSTPDLLQRIKGYGLDMHIFKQESPEYNQAEWATEQAGIAHEMGTDWIMFADADEFWVPPNGMSLKDYLQDKNSEKNSEKPNKVVGGYWRNSMPIKGVEPFYLNHYFKDTDTHKFIHKSSPDIQISMGNHLSVYTDDILADRDFKIYHFQHRDYKNLYTKFVLGAKALIATTKFPPLYGYHWREGLDYYQNNKFEEYTNQFFYTEEALKLMPDCVFDTTVETRLKGLIS